MGMGLGKMIIATEKIQQEVAKTAIMANSIEELAVKMKLPVETFKATVKRYNELSPLGEEIWILANGRTGCFRSTGRPYVCRQKRLLFTGRSGRFEYQSKAAAAG